MGGCLKVTLLPAANSSTYIALMIEHGLKSNSTQSSCDELSLGFTNPSRSFTIAVLKSKFRHVVRMRGNPSWIV